MEAEMTRDEVIFAIKREEPAIRRFGATALYLFGSAARDEIGPESDIDMFIEYDPQGNFTFVELFDLKDFLRNELRRTVDLTTRAGLHPRLRPSIEKASVRVF
jgi:uncharacterized protein